MSRPSSLFSLVQQDRLERLSTNLAGWKSEPDLLDACLLDIQVLRADQVGQAEAELRYFAMPRYWPAGPNILDRLFSDRAVHPQRLLNETPGLEQLFVFHGDGHLRAAALRKMTGPCGSAFEVAAILYRLNDWAEPVRLTAERCADRRFGATPAAHIAEAWLALSDRLRLWVRGPEQQRVTAALLSRADVRQAVAERIAGLTQGRIAPVLDDLARNANFDAELEGWARSATHPQVRARALAALLDGESRWRVGYGVQWIDRSMGEFRRVPAFEHRTLVVVTDREALIRQAASDSSPVVRRIAAQALVRHRRALPDWRDLALLLGRDSNPSVRERAEWVIAEMERAPA